MSPRWVVNFVGTNDRLSLPVMGRIWQGKSMKVKYFHDTDTALIEFSEREVTETKEINENIYIDLDAFGNLVAMTIEHAHQQASLPDLSYEQIENSRVDLSN